MDTRTLLLLGAGFWYLSQQDEETADLAPASGPALLPPGTYSPQAAGPAAGAAPSLALDINAGTNPTRLAVPTGAAAWRPDVDFIDVLTPPFWGVVGCCAAWATAWPSVRGARSGGGTMYSPRGAPGACGCKRPGEAGGRSWWLPIERAARAQGHVPAVEVAPDDGRWRLAGEGAGTRRRVKGFVHEGVAWVQTSQARNFSAIADADPQVIYLVSVLGRAAVHTGTGRPPARWQVRYKGAEVPASPDPWAVEPWAGWMAGRDVGYGRSRGSTPLEADLSGGRLRFDFVAPVYRWAFEALPVVPLPFTVGSMK